MNPLTLHVEWHHRQPPPSRLPIFSSCYYRSQVFTIHTSELPLDMDDSPHDNQVLVKGKEIISEAATPEDNEYRLPLSNLDLHLPPIEVGVFFCYKKKDNINMSQETLVDTIKRSLAGVLSTFYPLAGVIVQNSHGEPEVVCNNSGVEFVHEHADVELKELDFYHLDHSVRGKLVPWINSGLLAVQVKGTRKQNVEIFGLEFIKSNYWLKYLRFEI
ncbi:putative alcohol O-acetyltransferase [Helianthus anomalus]